MTDLTIFDSYGVVLAPFDGVPHTKRAYDAEGMLRILDAMQAAVNSGNLIAQQVAWAHAERTELLGYLGLGYLDT
jgi:hypothetical protein